MRILLLIVIIFASSKLAYKIDRFRNNLESEELIANILGVITDIFIIVVVAIAKEILI